MNSFKCFANVAIVVAKKHGFGDELAAAEQEWILTRESWRTACKAITDGIKQHMYVKSRGFDYYFLPGYFGCHRLI